MNATVNVKIVVNVWHTVLVVYGVGHALMHIIIISTTLKINNTHTGSLTWSKRSYLDLH